MDESMSRYRCETGHVIGFIKREGHGVSRLLYLRESFDEATSTMPELQIAAVIDSGDVTCSICGKSRVWVPSAPALKKILNKHKFTGAIA